MHYAVIGANFGDEGKGRTVDYLVSQAGERPLVVRYNSGSQAGHTVLVDGKRHVFSHFGSGTLRGADTLLCHKFVVNPVRFNQEYDQLVSLGTTPKVYMSHQIAISTPLDVLLNQIQEYARGNNRHGSCGMGFGETILRYESKPDLQWNSFPELGSYFLQQLIARGITPNHDTVHGKVVRALMCGDFNWDLYEREVSIMLNRVQLVDEREYLRSRDLIFEGAQGLMLHQDYPYFPHVTRCRTGMEDVVELMAKHQVYDRVEAFYCTRPYLTRHGAGPMDNELYGKPYEGIQDLTNIHNEYQGTLRFAYLDLNRLRSNIDEDLKSAYNVDIGVDMRWALSISCLDQVPDEIDVYIDGDLQKISKMKITAEVSKKLYGFGCSSDDSELHKA